MRIEDIDKEFQELAGSLKQGEEALQRGDLQLAETLLERAYSAIGDLGDEHPDAESCMSKLADVYFGRRKYAECTELLLSLYQTRARQVGSSHPSLVPILFRTAKSYERQGQGLEAEYVYTQTLGLINKLGIPDRPAAAAIVESFAGMLRGLNRQEEAEDLEAQARDLRDVTRQKLDQDIIKKISYHGVDVEQVLPEDDNLPRSGIKSLRRQSRVELVEPTSRMGKKTFLAIVAGILVLAIGGGVFALRYVNQQEVKKKKAAALAAKPVKIMPRSQTYKTLDGLEQLILFDNKDGTFLRGGTTYKGKYEMGATELTLKTKSGDKFSFPKDQSGFTDENGITIYKEGAQELDVVTAMRQIAATTSASYHRGAGYLSVVPTFRNAFTLQMQAPSITNIGSMGDNVNFDKLDGFRQQVNSVLTWSQYSTGRPGFIELYHYASADDGDTLYIKATDGRGCYLRSTQPQSAYVLQLVNGDLK